MFSSWVDSIQVIIQPAVRIIANGAAFNRGAAADKLRRTRSADITPELTRAERVASEAKVSHNDERDAIEASG